MKAIDKKLFEYLGDETLSFQPWRFYIKITHWELEIEDMESDELIRIPYKSSLPLMQQSDTTKEEIIKLIEEYGNTIQD